MASSTEPETERRYNPKPEKLIESSNTNIDTNIDTPLDIDLNIDLTQITLVHFVVGQRTETALVPKDAPSDDIKDLFRSAAEAGPCDIVKLYTPDGRLLNISPRIPPNKPSYPYRLEVVALHCNGILMDQVGIDLLSLEKRVSALEKILKNQSSPVENVQELKGEVSQLRNKLENYEHLSWLGFYKALHPPPEPRLKGSPNGTQPSFIIAAGSAGVGYHRRSHERKQIVCDKFLKLSDVVLTHETCQLLREPTFDNWQWEDEEMLVLLQQMYLDLELPKKFDIEINILRNFLINVYHHYNDVPFHNFRHCFCVTQMMFGMACKVNLPERVGDLETLILLTSCICHDLDHPGYNNIYQINAQTELALRYNDISPLENHHCSIAFRLLEEPECNLFRNLPNETYKKIREGMIRCILATDMARHNDIVNQFRDIIPYFDPVNRAHINLLSMVLIKVADISNEARPMDVAEPWLDCLLAEFFQQSDTEKLEGLPVTPFMDRDKITKPSSQCAFIGLVLLPLFEVLAALFTELEPVIIQPVKDALEYYRRLNEASQSTKHRKSTDINGIPMTTKRSNTSSTSSSQICDNKIPSDTPGNSMSRTKRANSVAIVEQVLIRPSGTNTHRRASHQQRKQSCSPDIGSSGSSTYKLSTPSVIQIPGKSSSASPSPGIGFAATFPSLDSEDSEREEEEDSDTTENEEDNTEVAVSERALKFKIATETSVDLSTSRKGSRENKSESSGQSTSIHTNATKDDRIPSFNASTSSLHGHTTQHLLKEDILAAPPSTPSSSATSVPTPKVKSKESFFSRLKLFTERLGSSAESRSGGESPPLGRSTGGFPNYFRRGVITRDSTIKTDEHTKLKSHSKLHHHGSCSDPEGQTKTSPIIELDRLEKRGIMSEGDSELEDLPSSPALSGVGVHGSKSSWKQCSGSLDSILSKEEQKRSPGKKLMLPRFSSFVQKRTRMGFMLRRSPKPKRVPSDQQTS